MSKTTGSVLSTRRYKGSTAPPTDFLDDTSRQKAIGTMSNVTWIREPSGLYTPLFNGDTSYIQFADNPALRMTLGGTILVWVKPVTLGEGNQGRILDKSSGGTTGTDGYTVYLTSVRELVFRINAGVSLDILNVYNFSVWQLLAITFNNTSRIIYTNGVLMGQDAVAGLPPNVSTNVRIGARVAATDRNFNGGIEGLRLFNFVLTQDQILKIFQTERTLFGV